MKKIKKEIKANKPEYVFAKNINGSKQDGIVDVNNLNIICLCDRNKSEFIINALYAYEKEKLNYINQVSNKDPMVRKEGDVIDAVLWLSYRNCDDILVGEISGREIYASDAMQQFFSEEVSKVTAPILKKIDDLENVLIVKNKTIDDVLDTLKELCDLKEIKDNLGTNADYNKRQPEAWKQARFVLGRLIGYGEPTDSEEWAGGFSDNH